jgi:hypothetical protein
MSANPQAANALVRSIARCACLGGLFLSAGCARTYDVKVDAIHDPQVTGGNSYRIVAKEPSLQERDPNFDQAVALVKNVLSGKGMYEAPNPADAEVVVEIDYGVGPRRTKIETEPGMEMIDPMARLGVMDPIRASDPRMPRTADGRPVTIIDKEDTVRASSVYDKHLSIAARQVTAPSASGEQRLRELWRVEVAIEDEKDDLASVLPVMAGAAVDYIGVNTGSRQVVRVSESGEPVSFATGSK